MREAEPEALSSVSACLPSPSPQAEGEGPSAASHGLGTALLRTRTRRGPPRRGSGNRGTTYPDAAADA